MVWRHYPGVEQPPFPTGERIIIERRDASALEFVFHRRYGGTEGSMLVRSAAPQMRDRIHILKPLSKDVTPQQASEAAAETENEAHSQ